MKIKWFYLAGVAMILILVIVGVLAALPRLNQVTTAAAVSETPAPIYLQGLEQKMFDPAVDAQGRQSLAEKIELFKQSQAYQSSGLTAPAAKDPSAVQFPPSAERLEAQALPSGIFPGSDGMVKPAEANIRNYLQQQAEDGSTLVVFAGSTALNQQEGLVILVSIDPAREVLEYQHYPHAAMVGAFTILSHEGSFIKLQAENGTIWYFDLVLRVFTQEDPYSDRT